MVVVLMVCNIKEGSATKHIVGGSDGWDESTDYDSWAKTQTFAVGDTLGNTLLLFYFYLMKFFIMRFVSCRRLCEQNVCY